MSTTCPSGSITRKAYTRHVGNKTVHVARGCILAQSESGQKRSVIDQSRIAKKQRQSKSLRRRLGTPRCKTGQIIREGYIRRAYTRKKGTRVKTTVVAPGCIQATGMAKKTGKKGKSLFVLQKGTLNGYHLALPKHTRHILLQQTIRKTKPLSVYRKLNALYVLNKNKYPASAKTYRKDANWVKTTTEYQQEHPSPDIKCREIKG